MTDLVERGRKYATALANPIVTELCDEIERLRQAVANHRDATGESTAIDRKLWDVLPNGF